MDVSYKKTGYVETADRPRRRLGKLIGSLPGPTSILVGGIHGNEPAGIHAISAVIRRLKQHNKPPCGSITGFSGNRIAVGVGARFIDVDLNRIWSVNGLVYRKFREHGIEAVELHELKKAITGVIRSADGPVNLLDLHSTSAQGPPFGMIGSRQRPSTLGGVFPVPIIQGLMDRLPGTLVHYMAQKGHQAYVFEGGQHRGEKTIGHIQDAIILFLNAMGHLNESHGLWVSEARDRLRNVCRGLPSVLHVRHRHAVFEDQDFEMSPGFRNFQMVSKGQVLALEQGRPVRAPLEGRLLMPRYQGQGTDGFFIGIGADER